MKSIQLAQDPKLHVIARLLFGSRLWGDNNKTSDIDQICIVTERTGDFVLRHKDGEYDNTYVGEREFLEGLQAASNVEFFEAIHSSQGKRFLTTECGVTDFDHFIEGIALRHAKAYLGYAKRDMDYFPERKKYVLRAIGCAEQLIKNKSILEMSPEILHLKYDHLYPELIRPRINTLKIHVKFLMDNL